MKQSDLDLMEELAVREARSSFWTYYRYINSEKKFGWWQKIICQELQKFYEDYKKGLRPKLVIQAPPQHGKSFLICNFITWMCGKDPDIMTIYTSFSERLGVRANLFMQRRFSNSKYQRIFPDLIIGVIGSRKSFNGIRNRELIEYVNRNGFFRNTTVKGSITGESLDIGIIDDPIKGREAANSPTNREKVWDWFVDDFFTRFSEDAGMLSILTRWHVDDPIGRFLKLNLDKKVRVISYPAIATCDEEFRKEGEALFPQHKSLEFLLIQKRMRSTESWESLYQQNPQIVGGEIIKGKDFGFYKILPLMKFRTIYADTAQKTSERNDYSVFQCWGLGQDRKIYLIDQIRGKWEAPELKRRAIMFWSKHVSLEPFLHGALRSMKVEDKSSGTGLIQDIRTSSECPIPISAIQRVKDKYTRVNDVVSYIESGYVMLPINGEFTNDFISECEAFTSDDSHMHDDQVDPMCDAINDMLASNSSNVWEQLT